MGAQASRLPDMGAQASRLPDMGAQASPPAECSVYRHVSYFRKAWHISLSALYSLTNIVSSAAFRRRGRLRSHVPRSACPHTVLAVDGSQPRGGLPI